MNQTYLDTACLLAQVAPLIFVDVKLKQGAEAVIPPSKDRKDLRQYD